MHGNDLKNLLEKHGWKPVRIHGSHHVLEKDDQILVVPIHASRDLKKGTANAILKRAGI
ncbi:MAG: type II toxin-antitoxin system HicA family toxin [Candidatus Margulisbacteria bacterium]|nr:type II toxin-antitoxin system HicA family toxin [Candidatus Margulisiibacteriota bacterium]